MKSYAYDCTSMGRTHNIDELCEYVNAFIHPPLGDTLYHIVHDSSAENEGVKSPMKKTAPCTGSSIRQFVLVLGVCHCN